MLTLSMMKSLIPVVMAGIVGVYGLVVSVLIANDLDPTKNYSLYAGCVHLAAGLATGFCGLGAGYAIGVRLDKLTRGVDGG